jgi:hypothetical protein
MPNRVLREGILTSERVNQLSVPAELFYRRLMSVADDFGRYSANLSALRSGCYPLRSDKVNDDEIRQWLRECIEADLVAIYEVRGSSYLEVLDFKQRTRIMRSKWPLRHNEAVHCWKDDSGGKRFEIRTITNDGQNDGQMTVKCPSSENPEMTVKCPSNDRLTPIQTNPNQSRGGERRSNDGQMTVIRFEPVKFGLYRKEYQAMIEDAKAEIRKLKENRSNYAKDMTDAAAELIRFLESKRESGWEARVKEVENDSGSYEFTSLKPMIAAQVEAWRSRIAEIRRAMQGIIN